MTACRVPQGHARRGKWLEQAVAATGEIYLARRVGYLIPHEVVWRHVEIDGQRRHVRVPSPVDFGGVFRSVALAFDAKVANGTNLRAAHVPEHQLDMLERFTQGTGIGFLLVSFERPDIGMTFACTAAWYRAQLASRPGRASVSHDVFERAARLGRGHCALVNHGEDSVPVNFGPAAVQLFAAVHGGR